MEKLSQRESVLLGYSPQRSFLSYPKSASGETDIDFNDVFGGPPRRSPIQEPRYSFGEAAAADSCGDNDTASSVHKRWSGLNEKPVFGEEGSNRRRYPSHDFFDDIFGGNESLSSSPRKHDRDPFPSSPGSRVLSPARPLPPRADPFGSPSLPAQFSLPARLIKDLPTFGSGTRNHQKSKDGASDGMGYYSFSPLSRFSRQANQSQEELRNDAHQWSCLSQELSLNGEDSSDLIKSDEADKGSNLKTDANSYEVPTNGSQFHFSIYKWASKGIPLVMPIRRGNNSGLKEKRKLERSASAKGWTAGELMGREVPSEISRDIDSLSCNDNAALDASFEVELNKQENGSLLDSSSRSTVEQSQVVEEVIFHKSDSETFSTRQIVVEDIRVDTISQMPRAETEVHYVPDVSLSGKMQEEASVVMQEAPKTDLKPQYSLFFDNDYDEAANETKKKNGLKESKVKITKKSSAVFNVSENLKKQDERRTTSPSEQMDGANAQGSPTNTRDRNRVRGKVREFVKIFNQEASDTAKNDANSQNQSSRRKEKSRFMAEDKASISLTKINEKKHLPDADKNNKKDASTVMDKYLKQWNKQHSETRTDDNPVNSSSGFKDQSAATAASVPDRTEAVVADADEPFQGQFVVKELSSLEDKQRKADDDYDDIQVVDARIRNWSLGKEANIRSLLSTLQYVLWPESGWKPIPLVDIIEGSAVKRTYQKALLYLHPDKLQQKGATSHQKYMAEKVFNILQEAWTHFTALGSL